MIPVMYVEIALTCAQSYCVSTDYTFTKEAPPAMIDDRQPSREGIDDVIENFTVGVDCRLRFKPLTRRRLAFREKDT